MFFIGHFVSFIDLSLIDSVELFIDYFVSFIDVSHLLIALSLL